ncbi:MAG: YndJ family transporter [Phaeodactylibacter sp.]|nr:YndJ family transporter [Phaeodactylibacter sp.]MCB9053927.1 YndJ family transporter [Lewinellaceae bacterium]
MSTTGSKGLQATITSAMLALGGVIGWLWPISFTSVDWVRIILISAPLLWAPLAVAAGGILVPVPTRMLRFFFPAALLFAFSFLLPATRAAGLCALPWLLLALWLAFRAATGLIAGKEYALSRLCATAAYLYLVVGAVWALAGRLGVALFGFDPVISLLTAVHFHFAGFLLLLLTGLALRGWGSPLASVVGWLSLVGPLLVAIGIFATHLEAPEGLELLAASVMATGGAGVAIRHLQLGIGPSQGKGGRFYWLLGGILLLGGMVLALLYGWRSVYPIALLSIPWMYAVHGSVNAAAMALLVVGWLRKGAK